MTLHTSTWFPWIFFGPLFLAIVSGVLFQITRMSLFATLAQIGIAVSLIVALLAFLAARNARRQAERKVPDTDAH